MEKGDILTALTEKLFINLVPYYDKKYTDKYLSYFLRLLYTRFNVSTNNESSIMNLILDRTSKLHMNNLEKAERIQNLYSNLSSKKTIKRKWAVLYLLFRISQENNENLINDSSKILQTIFHDENLNSYVYNNLNENEFANFNHEEEHKNDLIQKNKEPILVVNSNKTNKIITEKDLINDLIFVFQGIDGHFINYNSITNCYCLNPLIPFNDNINDIVSVLSDLGWLYKKVNTYLNYFNESNIPSQFIHSFSFAIQNELSEYYK